MDVKEALKKAKEYISDVYKDEGIEHVGVEEIVFDDSKHIWEITIGFFRPWDRIVGLPAALSSKPEWQKRQFKIVQIDDHTGRMIAMTHRILTASGRADA